MRYFLALFLLLATPAHADSCGKAKDIIHELITEQFVPVAELAVGDLPALIFVSPNHEYIILERKDENTACIIGGGVAFYFLKAVKA